jgi:hypothetical protein
MFVPQVVMLEVKALDGVILLDWSSGAVSATGGSTGEEE